MNSAMFINIFTAIVGVVMGILLFSGLLFENLDISKRLIFGAVFMGYGIYRYVYVQSKRNQMKREREIERIKRAQEELIKSQHKD
ncbi:MAG: hypothetical protein WC644_05195 [Ignavibacteria bacterium]